MHTDRHCCMEVRQTHCHKHFGYSKYGQGNGAVAQMGNNRDKRGNQCVGIRYNASTNIAYKRLLGWSTEQRAKGEGKPERINEE